MDKPPIQPRRPGPPGPKPGAQPPPPAAKPPERPGTRRFTGGPPGQLTAGPAQEPAAQPRPGTRRFVKGSGLHPAAPSGQAVGRSSGIKPPSGHSTPAAAPSKAPATRRHAQRAASEGEAKPKGEARAEAGGAASTGGATLGAKFALMTALTVIIASFILTILVYKSTSENLDREINDSGKKVIQILSCFSMNYWKELSDQKQECVNLVKQVQTIVAEASDGLKKVDTTIKAGDSQPLKEGITEAMKKFDKIRNLPQQISDAFARAVGENPFNLVKIDHKAILAIDILEPTADPTKFNLVIGSSTAEYALPPGVVVELDKQRGIEVRDSMKENIRVRRFQKQIAGGVVQVDMSLQEIDDARGRLIVPILLASVMVVIIGAGIGLVLARTVTKPVRTLLNDMNTVSNGDLDHQTIPHSRDEIGLLARTFNRMTKSLKVAHQAEIETKALEHELNIATEIQQNLLPKRLPKIPGFDIFATYKPSKEVGGDYFDFIQIDEDNMGIIVADVSGKGIPGSMVMTMARSLIRMEAERNLSTADTLIKVNRVLARDIRRGMFVTCIYMILNSRSKTLLVSSAGHNPLILWRQGAQKHELVNPSGIALGFDKGPLFERNVKQQLVELAEGDRFMAYTDGVVESMSPDSKEFGEDAFYALVCKLAEKESSFLINAIAEAIEVHQGSAPQHDDITMVTVRLVSS